MVRSNVGQSRWSKYRNNLWWTGLTVNFFSWNQIGKYTTHFSAKLTALWLGFEGICVVAFLRVVLLSCCPFKPGGKLTTEAKTHTSKWQFPRRHWSLHNTRWDSDLYIKLDFDIQRHGQQKKTTKGNLMCWNATKWLYTVGLLKFSWQITPKNLQ